MKLADTLDLGSNARACRFKSCRPYQINRRDLTLRSWRFFCYTAQELKLQRLGVKITPSSPIACTTANPPTTKVVGVFYFTLKSPLNTIFISIATISITAPSELNYCFAHLLTASAKIVRIFSACFLFWSERVLMIETIPSLSLFPVCLFT